VKKKIFEYAAAIASALAILKGLIIVFRVLGAAGSVNTVLTTLGLPHGTLELVEGWIDAIGLYFFDGKVPEEIAE